MKLFKKEQKQTEDIAFKRMLVRARYKDYYCISNDRNGVSYKFYTDLYPEEFILNFDEEGNFLDTEWKESLK